MEGCDSEIVSFVTANLGQLGPISRQRNILAQEKMCSVWKSESLLGSFFFTA